MGFRLAREFRLREAGVIGSTDKVAAACPRNYLPADTECLVNNWVSC